MTDAHANLPAVEAALAAIDALGYDEIVHTGDAIGLGPFPAETLHRLLEVPRIRFLMGNHDAWFVNDLSSYPPSWMSDGELAHQRWVHDQLTPDLKRAVADWPYSITEDLSGTRVVFTHYAQPDRRGGFAPIVNEPSPADLDRLFGEAGADVIFYGHHHPKSDMTGRSRYVNPGSLGCHDKPVARFAVLDVEVDGTYQLGFDHAAYEPGELMRTLEQRQVPDRAFIRRVFFRFGDLRCDPTSR